MRVFTSASSGFMFWTNFSDSLLILKFVRWRRLFEIWNYICIRSYQIILKHSREVCEMDKVVWNLFWVVRVRFRCKPGCQLLPTFSLIIICFGKKSFVSFQVGKPQAGTSFQNSLCQNLLTRILAESISLKAPICWKEILSWKTLFLEIVWRLVTSGCLAKPSS